MNTVDGIETIIKRDGSVAPYDRERIANAIFKAMVSVGENDRTVADTLAAEVERSLREAYRPETVPSVEDIQDMVEETLMKNGRTRTARAYIIYRHDRARLRAARSLTFEVSDNIPYKKIYEVLLWNMSHACDSVASLNRVVARGEFGALAAAADRRFEEEISGAVAAVLGRIESLRLVIIAGPSSSGKTTTTLKVSERLERAGVQLCAMNLDNYFFSLNEHPRDEFGDYDYESPQALDLALINEHLDRLLRGETVKTPHYDFKSGTRRLDVHEMQIKDHQLLLIDSLHGLYGEMTRSVPVAQQFKLYVETLGQFRGEDGVFMRWADNRLLRRMIRDKHFRNYQPMQTLAHWHYVRRSELQHIIPFIGTVDYVINSALPYELPVLKAKLAGHIEPAIGEYRDDPRRQDAYIRAKRVCDLLTPLEAVADDSCVSPTSLLREFIGGSRYAY
ncbi:MAG: response regulator SirA [Kiritimatiellae bacterium]|nr:response regulator SirA [Kiritimatiellia bacterium]